MLTKPFGRRSLLGGAGALTAAALVPWTGGCASDDDAITFFFSANPDEAAARELIGGNELGYLIFSLTSHGRALLANAHGNQLGARVTITQGTVKASGSISLVRFS